MSIQDIINERKIPELMKLSTGRKIKTAADIEKRREELKKIMQVEEYGMIPPKPDHLEVTLGEDYANFCAGQAARRKLTFTVTVGEKKFSWPVVASIPKNKTNIPAFVHINFRPDVPDMYQPTEEIIDNGFAVFSFDYRDVTSDNNDFKNGIAPIFTNRRRNDAPGKIAMWAWSAMRVMDYIETLPEIDKENVAVIGHSRLGKTALVAGGYDERFKYIISNDSGCSGAAITRGKQGEGPATITNVFPFWFCPKYNKNAAKFDEGKFDQHFLMALSYPRHLMVGSAKEDLWADPESEFLGAEMASEFWRLGGMRGLVHNGEIPQAKCVLDEGEVFYQVRTGTHYLGREDWQEYMAYIKKNI